MADPNEVQIEITSQPDELAKFIGLVDTFCDAQTIEDGIRFKLHMVIEELASNTINYGYRDVDDGWLRLALRLVDGTIIVTLEDGADQFDITVHDVEPDRDAELEDRQVGGLGIFLVKEMTDAIRYQREGRTNRVILEIKQ